MNHSQDPLIVLDPVPVSDEFACRWQIASIRVTSSVGLPLEANTTELAATELARVDLASLSFSSVGHRVELVLFDPTGQMTSRQLHDNDGKPTHIIYYNHGAGTNRLEFVYDSNRIWREQRMLHPDGTLNYSIVALRAPDGLLLASVYRGALAQQSRTDTCVYDAKGRLARLDMGNLGEWLFEYDDSGRLIGKTGSLVSMNALGERYQYHYDERGWLVRIDQIDVRSLEFTYQVF
ncbi:MAG TPA: RHS repeat domain-containing protein [Polyangiaceae bacterium]